MPSLGEDQEEVLDAAAVGEGEDERTEDQGSGGVGSGGDDGDDDGCEPSSSPASATPTATNKKKKKKKKKKQQQQRPDDEKTAPAAAAAEEGDSPESHDGGDASRRFSRALDLLTSPDPTSSLWVRFDGCGVRDSRCRTIASSLGKCRHAIEIDLSSSTSTPSSSANAVGDAGAEALAAALEAGGAPELLTLDLRGNKLGKRGKEALRSVKRKGLVVLFDGDDGEGGSGGKGGAGARKKNDGLRNEKDVPAPPSLSSSSSEDEEEGSDDDASDGGWTTGPASPLSSPSRSPFSPGTFGLARQRCPGEEVEALISEARKALAPAAKKKKSKGDDNGGAPKASPSPPLAKPRAAAAALFAAGAALAAEAADVASRPGGGLGGATVTVFGSTCSPAPSWPPPPGTRLSGLPPGHRAAAEKAPATLARALDTAPEGESDGDGRRLACGRPLVPGVGTHRVAAASLVSTLLSLRCPDADARVAASGALPLLLRLALEHGHCSALQAHALGALRSALGSPCEKLWIPLLSPSSGDRAPSSSAPSSPRSPSSAASPPRPFLLPAALADAVTEEFAAMKPGMRPPGHAFAVAAAAALLEVVGEREATKEDGDDSSDDGDGYGGKGRAAADSPSAAAVRAALSSCPRWRALRDGPLASVLEEQRGHLCEPPPSREPPSPPRNDFASLFGGGGGGGGARIDGQQLLQLLRSMQQL